MKMKTIHSGVAGTYPVRFRPGKGEPLLLCHPQRALDGLGWLERYRHRGRPLALLGAGDMTGFSCDAEVVTQDLLQLTGWQGVPSVQVAGFSVGGFPALLYGALLSLALPETRISIVVFSPLVRVWPVEGGVRAPKHGSVIRFLERHPELRDRMVRYGDPRPWLAKAAAAAGDRLQIEVIYPAYNERDSAQAELLSGMPGVTLLPVPTTQHLLHALLDRTATRRTLIAGMESRMAAREKEAPPELQRSKAARLADAIIALRRRNPDIVALLKPGTGALEGVTA